MAGRHSTCASHIMICRRVVVYIDRGQSDRPERGERRTWAALRTCVDRARRLKAQRVRIAPGASG